MKRRDFLKSTAGVTGAGLLVGQQGAKVAHLLFREVMALYPAQVWQDGGSRHCLDTAWNSSKLLRAVARLCTRSPHRTKREGYMNPAVVLPFIDRHKLTHLSSPAANPPVSRQSVKLELEKILNSPGFVRAARMRRFLTFIVEQTLAGKSSELCEYSIGIEVFERGVSFEPGIDPIVRNDARRLRQKLLEYYQRFEGGHEGRIRIEVPKGSYVPIFRPASSAPQSETGSQYRLVVTLVRVADGAEIWSAEHEYAG